jgi:uncharacterized protein (TIGR02001 family)
MRLKRLVGFGLVCLSTIPAIAELRLSAGLSTSNYYRGLAQTATGITYSGAIDYTTKNGFYLGTWLSRVNYDLPHDRRTLEVDYFVGYQKRYSPNWAMDFGLTRYTYNADSPLDYDWSEAHITTTIRDRWILSLSANDNWLAKNQTSIHASLTYRYPLTETLEIDALIGHQAVNKVLGFEYQYASIELVQVWRNLELRYGYVTSTKGSRLGARADSGWQLGVNWIFNRG